MPDHIRYDLLTQQALRSVVRHVLTETAKKGLPGDHHFYISFDTQAEGVRLSERMRAQYPQQITIILQHQYWDLSVSERGFEVGLSFGGIPEKLYVPFDSIKGFFDPSVQFGLQFEEISNDIDQDAAPGPQDKSSLQSNVPAAPSSATLKPEREAAIKKIDERASETAKLEKSKVTEQSGGAEVVRLDRFRKK